MQKKNLKRKSPHKNQSRSNFFACVNCSKDSVSVFFLFLVAADTALACTHIYPHNCALFSFTFFPSNHDRNPLGFVKKFGPFIIRAFCFFIFFLYFTRRPEKFAHCHYIHFALVNSKTLQHFAAMYRKTETLFEMNRNLFSQRLELVIIKNNNLHSPGLTSVRRKNIIFP